MLLTFLIAAGVFAIALSGMAIGVILSNRSIKGSCGGLNNFRDSAGNSICEACTTPSPECSGQLRRHKTGDHCDSHPETAAVEQTVPADVTKSAE